MQKLSFLFLGANSPWAYGLAEALAQQYHTHAVHFYDWRTYYRLRPNWSSRNPPSLLKRSINTLPTGYAGQLEKLFRIYLQQLVKNWCQQLKQSSGESPWVIASEPHFAPWVRKVPSERLIYYNFDDYVLYRPSRKDRILAQEKELIERAAITLCSSYSQLVALQKIHPYASNRIHHYPHGVVNTYLNHQPEKSPEAMTVGYVGNLGNRLDWKLIYDVVKACPEVNFVFVGGIDVSAEETSADWYAALKAVFELPNVRNVGKVPSDQVAHYYWSFAINWIPYVVDHSFNQAACPTKIMDGIASGRPIFSTDIPECRLYPKWITIFHNAKDAVTYIRQQLASYKNPEVYKKSLRQLSFAQQNTWQFRAQSLEKLLVQL
ncbi:MULTISPECIES: glycosyltransferase family protein [Nostocales]|uniref:Glycosyltransferase family 1 protein n=3 Tax=Nostocales TaxID=1161 RepID=A0A0C1NAY0_9CYAN|nr:hypothetical protein [Tolypothrix bouteillei]KAF3884593.1 glycosyltransferase family 1 protein [Tolypothrix bouteillei VB521301]